MNTKTRDPAWKSLYRIGGVAPLIALAFYLIQLAVIILTNEAYPTTPEAWFALFHRNKVLGLIFLNALDTLSIALLGTMYLALYVALKQCNPSSMAVAGLIISTVILRSKCFGQATAYVGILASLFTFADDISIVIAPSLAAALMPVNSLLWLVWWLLISRSLFRLGRDVSKMRNQMAVVCVT